ncbi:MAG: flavin reductase family protein [Candidatus Lokiarchaeota archaeon]|nr:flavin reductase family protein [Candidatus Lokiarchaeota archaeon]MBD3338248.1 flavin reductase family protein [Candidatus Lokiarchaeota archaeon]
MPVVLVGADVDGKPNFMPIAWISIAEHKPPMILISASQTHYTNKGIKQKQTFSVNTPSVDMVKITDYCGLNTGKDVDKSTLFDVFYGELETAPMIKECPLNLECKVVRHVDTGTGHDIFIGEIVQAYAEETIVKNNVPDIKKLQPLIFSMNDNNYWTLGDLVGRAWSIGKDFQK